MVKNLKINRTKDKFKGKFISTGSTLLDCAVSGQFPKGGIGRGKFTQIYGGFSTMKTILGMEILGSTQRLGGTAIFVDREYTFDFDRAGLFGLDVGKWKNEEIQAKATELEEKADAVSKNKRKSRRGAIESILKLNNGFTLLHTDTVENLFEEVISTICINDLPKPITLVVDSLTALPSNVEINTDIDEESYNTQRAKRIGQGFRKYLTPINNGDVTVVIIDQTRDKIGGMGKKHTVSGGKSLGFYGSTRIFLKHKAYEENQYYIKMGIGVEADIEKNKIYSPHNKVPIKVLWDIGVDDVSANLEWLTSVTKEHGVENKLSQKGSWFSWDDKKLGQGIDKAIHYIEKNCMWNDVEVEVKRVWDILHEPPKRINKHKRS